MAMPSAKRQRPGAPSKETMYKDQLHGNAAPFTPAPFKKINTDFQRKGPGVSSIPNAHSGQDETGTGKCGSP